MIVAGWWLLLLKFCTYFGLAVVVIIIAVPIADAVLHLLQPYITVVGILNYILYKRCCSIYYCYCYCCCCVCVIRFHFRLLV